MRIVATAVALVFACPAWAASLKLDAVYSDHMVLQRGQPLRFAGQAAEGSEVSVQIGEQKAAAKVANGRWQVELPAREAGGPLEITISSGGESRTLRDVLIGDVWLCGGQSNMHYPIRLFPEYRDKADTLANPKVRTLLVKVVKAASPAPQIEIEKISKDSWQPAEGPWLQETTTVGFFFADELQRTTQVPIGIIDANLGGSPIEAWIPRELVGQIHPESISAFETFKKKLEEKTAAGDAKAKRIMANILKPPGELYNGMIVPLQRFPIRGFIWYQGESNAREPEAYAKLFPALIRTWREGWSQGNLPFLFVQLPGYGLGGKAEGSDWAWLREAQAAALTEPNTAMAVTLDCGELGNLHPENKEPIGRRLATLARSLAGESLPSRSPSFKAITVEGDKATISFDHVGAGLEARELVLNKQKDFRPGKDPQAFRLSSDQISGFSICGEDKIFVPAQATLQNNEVTVFSPQVQKPLAVRYAWVNFPLANLFSKDGLPVEPFRTDDFPVVKGSGPVED